MPHTVFNVGPQTASGDFVPKAMVPGIEPGGSRVGAPTKPALRLIDAWAEIIDRVPQQAADYNAFTFYLKLSKSSDLDPGLILPVAHFGDFSDAVNTRAVFAQRDLFKAQGTTWAAAYVGIRMVEVGTANIDVDIHLDFEIVDISWMDWFLRWEWLDNVVDNSRDY